MAGGILGALAGVLLICSSKAGLPPQAAALIAIASLAVMTGALHEDGLGDTADGFFGGSTLERRLEIMKDSHIGTFSALTLIVVIGLKIILLASIIERSNACHAAFTLIGIEAASRAAMVIFWHKLPSARPGGLADRSGTPDQSASRFALILGAALLALTFIPIGGFGAVLIGTLLSAAVLFGFAKLCIQKINGQTGDTLGAAQQITTLTLLASLVMTL